MAEKGLSHKNQDSLDESGKVSGEFACHSEPQDPQKQCPECASIRLYKDGMRYTDQGPVQRLLCRNCGHRFSEKTSQGSFRPLQKTSDWHLKARVDVSSTHRVCISEDEMNNLVEVARQEQAQREGTLSHQKIVDFIWYMKKNGRAETTILGRVKLIKRLAKLGADLYNPEDVKRVIAQQQWTAGRKDNACDAYTTFLTMNGGTWQRPIYKPVDKELFIPQPSEVRQLIAGCSSRMACFLQALSETAMRPGELWQLEWKDYDQPTRTLRVNHPEKGSKSGTYKISKELAAMLESLPHKYGDRVFSKSGMLLDHHSWHFAQQRKRIARKLKNPRLLDITFKTFRHWKATMEAWRTNSPWIVQEFLRHKSLKNTERYVHLAKVLFKDQHEYITSVAQNVKEACALIEKGWKYTTGEYNDGGKIFAKPKDPLASEQ